MKILHTSDLHIGKYIGTYDLKEDTEYVLNQVVDTAIRERVEVVLISGDIFDRPNPSEEAIKMYVSFLKGLLDKNIKVIAISGNHDSGIRLSAYKDILGKGYFVEGEFNSPMRKVSLNDEYGPVNFYMLPFFTPFIVKSNLKLEKGLENYDLAMDEIIKRENIDTSQRNIILAHQFVAGFKFGGSEEDFSYSNGDEKNVAGVGIISLDKFQNFDYVALGHIHASQKIKYDYVRYAGSLMKYSFDEVHQKKGMVEVTIDETGVSTQIIPLKPQKDLVKVVGKYEDVLHYPNNEDDFVAVELLDKQVIGHAYDFLKEKYPYLLQITYQSLEKLKTNQTASSLDVEKQSPIEIFKEFYEKMKGEAMSQESEEIIQQLLEEVSEDDAH